MELAGHTRCGGDVAIAPRADPIELEKLRAKLEVTEAALAGARDREVDSVKARAARSTKPSSGGTASLVSTSSSALAAITASAVASAPA